MSDVILEMRNISKQFPGVKALNAVNLKVKEGEIHAICGENGAGKSTLINILSGVHPAGSYEGEIYIKGKKCAFSTTADAEEVNIVCIHQELELIPELSVGENMFLGNYPARLGIIQWEKITYDASELLQKVGLAGNEDIRSSAALVNQKVRNLGIGQQQLIEIAKALARNAKILIFDEPTAALSENEVDNLLSIIDGLKRKGITCIYISHRLDEVIKIADTVTVLRDGKSIGTDSIRNLTKNSIISMMVGRELTNLFPRQKHERGDVVLEVKNYSVWGSYNATRLIKDVSFKAYRGEILGISGLMGAGRTELFSSIFGALGFKSEGEVFIENKKVAISSTVGALKNGLFLLTEDRKKFGLVLGMNVKENTTMASLKDVSKIGFLNTSIEIFETNRWVEKLKTKTPTIEVKVNNLSGGNQQKVVLQKALMTKPKVLVLDEPTRGIDVGAKYEIYRIMNQLVEEGVTVIMISSEMQEILGICDRILVMSRGQFTAEYMHDEATQEKIMHSSIGG